MTPRTKRWLLLYPVFIGVIIAVRLCGGSRELDEVYLAEATVLGVCVIGVMILNRRSAGR